MDGVGELGDVEDAELPFLMQPNLDDAWPDGGHGPPVIRIESLLNLAELIPCRAGRRRKGAQIIQRGTEKVQVLHKQLY